MNTSPIFSRQASTQVLAVLSDARPGAVKNNNMSRKLTTVRATENGTRLRVEKILSSALEFMKCQDSCLDPDHWGTAFMTLSYWLTPSNKVLLLRMIAMLLRRHCMKHISVLSRTVKSKMWISVTMFFYLLVTVERSPASCCDMEN